MERENQVVNNPEAERERRIFHSVEDIVFRFTPHPLTLQPQPIDGRVNSQELLQPKEGAILFALKPKPANNNGSRIRPTGPGCYKTRNEQLARIERETGVNQGRRQRKSWWRKIFGR